MMQDKNYDKCINEIGKLRAKIILTKPDYKRSAEADVLYKAISRNKSRFIAIDKFKDALKFSKQIAEKDDLILITGSFFLVSDYFKISDKYN